MKTKTLSDYIAVYGVHYGSSPTRRVRAAQILYVQDRTSWFPIAVFDSVVETLIVHYTAKLLIE